MNKSRELYTIVRKFRQGDIDGIDILGIARTFEEAAKFVDDRIEEKGPFVDWELEDLEDDDECDRMEIEDLHNQEDLEFLFYDIFGPAELICSYRYRFPSDLGHWTYCWFYIAGADKV